MRKLFVKTLLFVTFLVGLGGAAGYMLMLRANTPSFSEERAVKIPPGAGFDTVVDSLQAAGVLASAFTFETAAQLTGWDDQMKAGHYTFSAGASNYDLLNTLRKGLQTPVRLTIPPGTRPEVLAAVAGREMAFTASDFLAALKDPALAESLGTDTTHLFSYMLPETYFFYWLTNPATVIAKVKTGFDDLYTKHRSTGTLSQDLNPDEVLRMASIVEWETNHVDEKDRIAGVYLNRLRDGWPLQADPTVQYAILASEGQKRRLLFSDYRIQHPYNTYTFRGLPPGPVCNPSPTSIQAVLNPEAHQYFFFVARGDGTHIFSRTLAEHNRAANAYRRMMQQRRREQQGG